MMTTKTKTKTRLRGGARASKSTRSACPSRMNRLANSASNGCVQNRSSIVKKGILVIIPSFELFDYLASPAACMFFDFAFVIW